MNQKGFVPILIILILAALVGGYLVYQTKVNFSFLCTTLNPEISDSAVREKAEQLLKTTMIPPPDRYYEIEQIQISHDCRWGKVTVVTRLISAEPFILLAQFMNNKWEVVADDNPQFLDWLSKIPGSLISEEEKISIKESLNIQDSY